jgi:hypothetical protein
MNDAERYFETWWNDPAGSDKAVGTLNENQKRAVRIGFVAGWQTRNVWRTHKLNEPEAERGPDYGPALGVIVVLSFANWAMTVVGWATAWWTG